MEENQIELENVTKLFEKFKSTSEFVSSILDIPLPNELQQHDQDKEEEEPTNTVVEVVKSKSMNEDDLNGVWEDVKEKNFYTVIPLVGELIEAHQTQMKNHGHHNLEMGREFKRFAKMENINSYELDQLVVEFNNLNLNNKATKTEL